MDDEKREKRDFNRRTFIGAVAALGAGAVLASCKKTYPPLTFVDVAPDGPVLKAGLIGCGERGTGAALNFLKAGPNLKIVALGDVLQDHLDKCRDQLAQKAQQQIADDHCFVGFDAYKKVLAADVDLVLWPRRRISGPCISMPRWKPRNTVLSRSRARSMPPACVLFWRPARKPRRTICAWWREPSGGTTAPIRKPKIASLTAPSARSSGRTPAGTVDQLWYVPKKKEWSDMEGMIRDWANWRWLSGDHICEQHVHNLDTVLWFTGMNPTRVSVAVDASRR